MTSTFNCDLSAPFNMVEDKMPDVPSYELINFYLSEISSTEIEVTSFFLVFFYKKLVEFVWSGGQSWPHFILKVHMHLFEHAQIWLKTRFHATI